MEWGVFDTPLQLNTYDPSKYRYDPPTGYVRFFEIPMQFSNWVRAILRNTDAILQLGTCGPSKTVPFLSSSGPWGGRIRYAPTSGYVRPFKKLSCFRPLRDRGVGVCDTPLQPGTCEGSKNGSVFATVGGVRWAYAIRPYNRIRVILRNTDAISQPGTCDSSKYRCDFPTEYV